jgi:3-carboxymuconate cyclase
VRARQGAARRRFRRGVVGRPQRLRRRGRRECADGLLEVGALGQLAPIGCVSNNGTNGLDGTKHSCADGDALKGAYDIALSPDGKNVYVAASDSGGIAVFTRDPATGKIVQTGCVRGVSTCVGARALAGAAAVVVSPDGRNVYLASYGADAVVMFQRDPATGALKGLGCISDDGTDRQCASGNALRGAGRSR